VFVAEIGDVHRFPGPAQLASWAGLTPKHHESDTHVHRGRITKQGSRLVRWAAIESVQALGPDTGAGRLKRRVGDRRGRNIGKTAAARQQLDTCTTPCGTGTCDLLSTVPGPRHDVAAATTAPGRGWSCRS
jgi:transposase